ncbi:PHB depolymerase family esterase [Dokdonella sp.]|uniref:alpha/beta hydrolase family esterase n=1 Tax=Dokdonella sp. TaxID=2291710 RepID=UPI002F3FEA7B
MRLVRRFAVLLALAPCVCASALAASTVRLPGAMCPGGDAIFDDGYESRVVPHDPSGGSGGAYPGNVTRTIGVPGVGTRSYYLHVPPGYTPTQASPLLLALRGQSLPTATAAQQVRTDWTTWADSKGFLVLAPVGNSTQGGWGANGDIEEISAALDDVQAAYNIERSRIYLWGFSAGAHYGHALALNNATYFAAYGVSAGSLEQYTCTDSGNPPPACASFLGAVQPKIPIDIHLGNSDPLYTQYGAGDDPQRFEDAGWIRGRDLYFTLFGGGHTYTVTHLGQIWNHICPFALGP